MWDLSMTIEHQQGNFWAAWGNNQPPEKPTGAAAAHRSVDLSLVEAVVQLHKKPVSGLFQEQCMIILVYETPCSVGFGPFRKYLELLLWYGTGPEETCNLWSGKDQRKLIYPGWCQEWDLFSVAPFKRLAGRLWGEVNCEGKNCGWGLSFVAFNLEIAVPRNRLCSAYQKMFCYYILSVSFGGFLGSNTVWTGRQRDADTGLAAVTWYLHMDHTMEEVLVNLWWSCTWMSELYQRDFQSL